MSVDNEKVARVRIMLAGMGREAEERKMFGGVCFLLNSNMVAGISGEKQGGELMLRCGEERAAAALDKPYARLCDFTGRIMKSILLIEPMGFETDQQLRDWLELPLDFLDTEPPKKKKPARKRKKPA